MHAYSRENGTKPKPIDPQVIKALVARKWPGNVRELKNVVERMAILSGDRVTIADLPEDPHESPFGEDEAPEAPATAEAPFEEEQASGVTPAPPATPHAGAPHLTLRAFREQSER